MPEAPRSELMAGYRVLDLSDEKGMLCGKCSPIWALR